MPKCLKNCRRSSGTCCCVCGLPGTKVVMLTTEGVAFATRSAKSGIVAPWAAVRKPKESANHASHLMIMFHLVRIARVPCGPEARRQRVVIRKQPIESMPGAMRLATPHDDRRSLGTPAATEPHRSGQQPDHTA